MKHERSPTERVLVWGAGGHGRVVADLVRAIGHEVVGFVDRDAARVGQRVESGGARVVVGEDAFVAAMIRGDAYPDRATGIVVALGDNAARLICLARVGARITPSFVHPSATCSASVIVGPGTVVLAQAVVNAGAALGTGVIVNSGAVVEHDCVLDDGAHVSPGAVLSGGVRVGARSWIGAGATVIQGVTIGRDAIVGAGTVVIRDVADGVTVVGNPARAVATRTRPS